ncbi:MAG: diguanylate cyclase [Microthrixaceae bacterium]
MTPADREVSDIGQLLVVCPEQFAQATSVAGALADVSPDGTAIATVSAELHDRLAQGTVGAVVLIGSPDDPAVASLTAHLRHAAFSVAVLLVVPDSRRATVDLALACGAHEVVASQHPSVVTNGVRRAILRHQFTVMNTSMDIDPLTGLLSRVKILGALEAASRRCAGKAAGVGAIYVDIDRFKAINDTFGHAAGDSLLASVGERISSAIGEGAVKAGRLGGDEFLVVVEGMCIETLATAVAQRINAAMEAPFSLDGELLSVQVSMGVATNGGAEDPATVLHRADAALYRSKRGGRNRTSVSDDTDGELPHLQAARLGHALREGGLVLKSNLRLAVDSGQITACSWAPSWPEAGISGAELESRAVDAGLTLALNRWVIREAIGQSADRRHRISVRLGAGLLATAGLAEWICGRLHEHDVPAERLELLVDEAELSIEPVVLTNLNQLSDRGIRVGIDRFGSTVGSLAFLAHAHIDTIVLADDLVRGCASDVGRSAIVQGVTFTAQALGATVVAPRLGNPADRDVLLRAGCEEQEMPRHPALVAQAERMERGARRRPTQEQPSAGGRGSSSHRRGGATLQATPSRIGPAVQADGLLILP